MPRKRIDPRTRRRWALRDLHIRGLLEIRNGWAPGPGAFSPFTSLDDVRDAWEELQDMFMTVCLCDLPQGERLHCETGHRGLVFRKPGEAPWAFWRFEMKKRGVPSGQEQLLRKMGIIGPEEARAIKSRQESEQREKRRSRDIEPSSLGEAG